MNVTSQEVIITDPYIVGFMTRHRNSDDILNACKSVLRSFCQTVDDIETNQSTNNRIMSYLSEFEDRYHKHARMVESKINDVESHVTSTSNAITTKLSNQIVTMASNATQKHIEGIYNMQATLHSKLEDVKQKNKSPKEKGIEGETGLFNILNERLMARDGYSIQMVSGMSQSCDIIIKRDCYPTVRIESKAIGKDNGAKVKYAEVEKFNRDLLQVNNHGIFVSIHSGIQGIGHLELQQLSNGKFAVFLSNNNYDVDIIIDMLHLLYKLDQITNDSKYDENIIISSENMIRVRSHIQDSTKKISAIKHHMKESIRLINTVQLDLIESIVLGNVDDVHTDIEVIPSTMQCDICKKTLTSKQGFIGHVARCKAKIKQKD